MPVAANGVGFDYVAGIDPTTGASTAATSSMRYTATDRSGAITTGGTAQPVMAANSARAGGWIQNLSSADLWVNEIGGAAVAAQPSIKIPAGQMYAFEPTFTPRGAVSIFGATTGQAYSAREW